MARAITDIEKSRRGRPRTDSTPVMVRFSPDQLARLDQWIDAQNDALSRPEAIRRLLGIVLDDNQT